MNSKLLLSFVVAILFLAACNQSASKYRVKTMYHVNTWVENGQKHTFDGITDTFYYAADGKLENGTKGLVTKQEHNGNMTLVKNFNGSGKLVSSSTTFLNDKGLEDSVSISDPNQQIYAHKYFYDSSGNLIEDRQDTHNQPATIISKYKVVDGNRVEEHITHLPMIDTIAMVNPVTLETETVVQKYFDDIFHNEFFPDKLNMPTKENFGYTNHVFESKNLIKKQVQLSDKGDTSDIFLFRYNFDDKGRVISVAQVCRSGQYDSTSYTYY